MRLAAHHSGRQHYHHQHEWRAGSVQHHDYVGHRIRLEWLETPHPCTADAFVAVLSSSEGGDSFSQPQHLRFSRAIFCVQNLLMKKII